ncbi:unnamed protein product [Brachionus calyciflorus]|uniref:NIDO domain-containing protein n=1 Tax=Brachionus calyciflorus TaxID=104777 RepID=A0A814EZ56_9BILA|nr:unnamed protein product [Brachionus calyciflorus]
MSSSGVSKDNFIPFGLDAGDTLMSKTDDEFEQIFLSTKFPFFENFYNKLWVNTNGLISFDRGVREVESPIFPNNKFVCISPFWSDIDTTFQGDIFYRQISNKEILSKIEYEIIDALYEYETFKPNWAFVVTWLEVPEFQINKTNNLITNTFQVVLTTNTTQSFTIFNYEKLLWSTYSTQSGFNAGDGIRFFNLPGTFSESVKELVNISNIGVPGKWIFRTDSSEIIDSGCITDNIMRLNPKNVSINGGEMINVTGPCFEEDDFLFLIIDSIINVECKYLDRYTCVFEAPKLNKTGSIAVMLVINAYFSYESTLVSYEIMISKSSTTYLYFLIPAIFICILITGLIVGYIFYKKNNKSLVEPIQQEIKDKSIVNL